MARSSSKAARRLPWLVLALVVVGALVAGTRGSGSQSQADQARSIAATVKCPQCSSQSAATSDAPTAAAIRRDIAARLARGQSADQIRDYYASRYGESILLTPGRSGAAGLVWIIPVVGIVLAFAGLGLAFRRWQNATPVEVTDADRALVAEALEHEHHPDRAPAAVGGPDEGGDPDRLGDPDGAGDPHGEGSGR